MWTVTANKHNPKIYNSATLRQLNTMTREMEAQGDTETRNCLNLFNNSPRKTLEIDSIFYHYLSKELLWNPHYRKRFRQFQNAHSFKFILLPTRIGLIDYNWNDRVFLMVRERCELDHALSWLSTLGGAFSALGDYFSNCAEIAGKISVNQLKLALRLGDPGIASRCKLYFALSLIQKQKYRHAKKIILFEYNAAMNAAVCDTRLIRMCKGIWSKLQYEHYLHYIGNNKKPKIC